MAEGQVTPKVKDDQIDTWHKTNPVAELLYSQTEVAKFLELGYLALRDHTEVAAEIRSTAQKSRTQHVLTAGLFKKFVVTSSSVVNTYCPMMLDAVELETHFTRNICFGEGMALSNMALLKQSDIGERYRDIIALLVLLIVTDKDIAVEAFEQVLELCIDMKKETEEARESYLTIQDKVQNDLSKVNITNRDVRTRMETLELEKKTEKECVKEMERQQMELDKEKEELKNKVKKLQENRDEWLEKAAPPTGESEVAHTFIDFALTPTGAMVAGPVRAAVGAVATGLNIWRKKEEVKQAIKASHEANAQLTSTYEEKRKVEETASEKRMETLAKLAHIEALDLEKASLGDIKSLKEAVVQLCNVDKQFMKIILFWDSMATMLKHLYQDQKAGKVYLKKIEDKRYADKFKLSIDKAENTWNRIGIVCQNYVEINDEVIFNVYGFLSSPVDNMTDTEIAQRKAKLIEEIKHYAKNADNADIADK